MLHSGENQQPRHDPSFSQGQRFQFNGVPKTPSPVTNPDLDKKKELPVPELEPPRDFQAQLLIQVRAVTKTEGGIPGRQVHEIVARNTHETVWTAVYQSVQHNARILLEQGQRLLEPFQGKFRYQLQHQQLDEVIRLRLSEILDPKDHTLDPASPHNTPGWLENEPPQVIQTEFPSEPQTQEQIDFLVFNVTRTGSAKDPYFPAGITRNKILQDTTLLLSPVYLIDIGAAILIQSADRDVLTAGVVGLVFVILSTVPFVFSAYYFAILKGYQQYKQAYLTNFSTGFRHPQTGQPEPFVDLPPWTKEMAYGGLIFGTLVLGLMSAYRFSILWKAEDGFQNHLPEFALITAIILLTIGIFFYKVLTSPTLPLGEQNRYYELRKRVPHLIPLLNEKNPDSSEAVLVQPEAVEKSEDHSLQPGSPTQIETVPPLNNLQDAKRYYQQRRSELQEEYQTTLRELTKVSDNMTQLITLSENRQKRAKTWLDLQWGILRDTLHETGTAINSLTENEKNQFFDLYLELPVEMNQIKPLIESINQAKNRELPTPMDLDAEYAKLKQKDKSVVVFGQTQITPLESPEQKIRRAL